MHGGQDACITAKNAKPVDHLYNLTLFSGQASRRRPLILLVLIKRSVVQDNPLALGGLA